MTSLEELAKKLNVSRATLDRVIHDRPGVKKETKELILKRINEIGYKPNSAGKALALQKKLNFGIILSSDLTPEDNTLFSLILEGMQLCIERLQNRGVNFIIRRMTTGRAEDQVKAIDEFIKMGVTGIAICPEGERKKEIPAAVQRAREKGIIVTCYFNHIEADFNYFVGSDSAKEGRVAVDLLEKFMHGAGEVALFSGFLHNTVHQTRIASAVSKIHEYDNLRIVANVSGNYTENIAYNSCLEIIRNHPDVKGIIASCGGIAGIVTALKECNQFDKVKVIFFDFTTKAEIFVMEGLVDALIGVDLIKLGYCTIKSLYELAIYGFANEIETTMPMLIKTKESL
jgi:LacI family transcriptional regulator